MLVLERWFRQGTGVTPRPLCSLMLGAVCLLPAPSEAQPQTTSLPVFDPAQVVRHLEETSFETIDFPQPFANMGHGEALPNPSKAGGLQARVIVESERINGLTYNIYDTPLAARRGFELRAEDYRVGESGGPTELVGTEWEADDRSGADIHVFCVHEPLTLDPPPDVLRCVVLDPDRQVGVETLALEPLTDAALRDVVMDASLATLDRALTVLGDIVADLEPVGAIELSPYAPDGEGLRDPAAIVAGLTAPEALAELTARLQDRADFGAPFQEPQEQILQEVDAADREHGVEGYVVFFLEDRNLHGVIFVVHRDSDAAERDLSYFVSPPETLINKDRVDVEIFRHELLSETGERFEFFCGQAPEIDGTKPNEMHCSYHPPGSQILITVFSHALESLDQDKRGPLTLTMGAVLEEAVELAVAIEQSLPVASPGPSAETLRQLDELVARIDGEIAGTADFVYSDGGFGLTKRLLQNDGAALDGPSRLRVQRRACLALLPTDMAQGNECRQEPLFRPYGLEIEPARLDPATIAIEADNGRSGVEGWSLRFACAGDSPCARVTADDFQAQVIAQGFEETLDRPNLFLHCMSRDQCAALAEDLRKLIALAPHGNVQQVRLQPEPQPQPTPQPVGDSLVGVWYLAGIGTLDFRADGTYSFDHPTHSHAGTYTAQSGVWSQSSKTPTMPWEDGGTYKLLDPNWLELVGKLGGAVWQRRAAP